MVYQCEEFSEKTVIIPVMRLPIGDYLQTIQTWALKIYINDALFAEHHFEWFETATFHVSLRDSLVNDGELPEEILEVVETMFSGEISLDALLNDVNNSPKSQRN